MNDRQQTQDDSYARESFTFRRMTRGQVWAISIAAILFLVLLIALV